MSLDPSSFLLSQAANSISQKQAADITAQETKLLALELRALRESQEQPFLFLKSTDNNLSSNVADGVIILSGLPVPPNNRATIQDFNINFTTTAGTVRLVIVNANKEIVIDVLRDINSSVNGTGSTVLEEGQRLAVVGQTAGAGVFSVYCTGKTQKVFN